MTATFHHFGVPTTQPQTGETYLEGAMVYITDPEAHPFRVEFVRFEEGSPMPDALKTQCHAAYMVESLEQAMAGKPVVIPPFEPFPGMRCAFVYDGAALIELMQAVKSCGCSCCG